MVLDGSTLTVELVVDDPRGLGLGGVEASLGDRASLLRGTLGKAGDVALSEHGGWLWGGAGGLLGGERSRSTSYVEIRAALVDSRDPPAYVT